MSNKDFRCARITGQATSLRVKGKRFGNNCLKGMNIGSGWERKSIMQRCPFIFMIRTENSRNNQTVGRKTTLRLRASFRKPQAVTLSSLAWRNRQQPARIGRWRMVSDKVDFLAGNCMAAMPDAKEEAYRGQSKSDAVCPSSPRPRRIKSCRVLRARWLGL